VFLLTRLAYLERVLKPFVEPMNGEMQGYAYPSVVIHPDAPLSIAALARLILAIISSASAVHTKELGASL